MPVKNTIKDFLDSRGLTVYRFHKDTGLSQTTAYRLYNESAEIPRSDVMQKICDAYRIQPGEILRWVPNEQEKAS